MRDWRNGPSHYGWVSQTIHWAMAALIVAQLGLGLYVARMAPGLANLWLYGLHKSLGILALLLVVLRLIWHRISPPPPLPGSPDALANRLARGVHRSLYALLLVLPLLGWSASSATGLEVLVLDRWALPTLAPVSPLWEEWGFALHRAGGWALIALLVLHVAGAGLRGIGADGSLRRMIPGLPR